MRHGDVALGHHGSKIPIAQPVRDVPANTEFNRFGLESASTINLVARHRFGHPASIPKWVGFWPNAVNAPEPKSTNTSLSHGETVRNAVSSENAEIQGNFSVPETA
jgi:hypothetical protein